MVLVLMEGLLVVVVAYEHRDMEVEASLSVKEFLLDRKMMVRLTMKHGPCPYRQLYHPHPWSSHLMMKGFF